VCLAAGQRYRLRVWPVIDDPKLTAYLNLTFIIAASSPTTCDHYKAGTTRRRSPSVDNNNITASAVPRVPTLRLISAPDGEPRDFDWPPCDSESDDGGNDDDEIGSAAATAGNSVYNKSLHDAVSTVDEESMGLFPDDTQLEVPPQQVEHMPGMSGENDARLITATTRLPDNGTIAADSNDAVDLLHVGAAAAQDNTTIFEIDDGSFEKEDEDVLEEENSDTFQLEEANPDGDDLTAVTPPFSSVDVKNNTSTTASIAIMDSDESKATRDRASEKVDEESELPLLSACEEEVGTSAISGALARTASTDATTRSEEGDEAHQCAPPNEQQRRADDGDGDSDEAVGDNDRWAPAVRSVDVGRTGSTPLSTDEADTTHIVGPLRQSDLFDATWASAIFGTLGIVALFGVVCLCARCGQWMSGSKNRRHSGREMSTNSNKSLLTAAK
jgi:hypothetical protein